MSYDVYGVGAALVDVQARVKDEIFTKLPYEKGIMTLVDDATQVQVLSQLNGASISRCAGGSAANTIIGVADFGGKGAFAGKVSSDPLGDFFLEDMQNLGVKMEVQPAAGQTGTCVVLITEDAQRTMLTHLGVSSTLGPDDIQESEIVKSKYVYIEGYLFTGDSTRAAALRTIELAKKHGVKVAFTASDPFLINLFRDQFWELIKGPVDLLFCNLDEARSLTGLEDAIDCAHEIHKHSENVALTMSGDGSIIMHEGEAIPVQAAPVKAIDTTGAGDMYAAGLLYGVTNGMTWKQAGHLASQAAGRVVAQMGARLSRKFTRAEIDQFAL
ncbi:MAG: adenosine kinase [Planctomycetaceae bacterium]|nr:adenosine kinase [Planctomycetaceae bacterium]MCA9097010.1 adenosine kinase [Planctomycetaceae bacterium]